MIKHYTLCFFLFVSFGVQASQVTVHIKGAEDLKRYQALFDVSFHQTGNFSHVIVDLTPPADRTFVHAHWVLLDEKQSIQAVVPLRPSANQPGRFSAQLHPSIAKRCYMEFVLSPKPSGPHVSMQYMLHPGEWILSGSSTESEPPE